MRPAYASERGQGDPQRDAVTSRKKLVVRRGAGHPARRAQKGGTRA